MRAKLIENNNFERGFNPKRAIKIGILQKLEKIYDVLEDSSFQGFELEDIEIDEDDLTIIASYTNECDPEYFHNPVSESRDWQKKGILTDFKETYTITIDFIDKTLSREFSFENWDIDDWEFSDDYEFDFTENPEEITDMIGDDISTFDVHNAEQSAWKAASKLKKGSRYY